jgi:hypothetical protein
MNVSLSSLLYSFMLSCLAESGVCPSMLSSNNTSKKYEIQITLLVPKPLKNNEINRKCMFWYKNNEISGIKCYLRAIKNARQKLEKVDQTAIPCILVPHVNKKILKNIKHHGHLWEDQHTISSFFQSWKQLQIRKSWISVPPQIESLACWHRMQ